MAGASGSFDDVPWYTTATDWVKQKTSDLIDTDINIFNKLSGAVSPQLLGPVGAAVQGVQLIQKNSGAALTNGIKLPSSALDKLFNPPSLDSDLGDVGGAVVKTGAAVTSALGSAANSFFNDTQKKAGGADDSGGGFVLPFWVKTAIVASIVIGTALIVKGSFEK